MAARTSPRPAFGPRAAPGGPGGAGHQPPHGPLNPPPQCPGPFGPPNFRCRGPACQGPPDLAQMPRQRWPSRSPPHLNALNRPGSASPAPQAAAVIIRAPPGLSRYDHDISAAYVSLLARSSHNSMRRPGFRPPADTKVHLTPTLRHAVGLG